MLFKHHRQPDDISTSSKAFIASIDFEVGDLKMISFNSKPKISYYILYIIIDTGSLFSTVCLQIEGVNFRPLL